MTAAADELVVTQPSVSSALAALSRELDCELFERAGRSIRLTAAGAAFAALRRRRPRAARAGAGPLRAKRRRRRHAGSRPRPSPPRTNRSSPSPIGAPCDHPASRALTACHRPLGDRADTAPASEAQPMTSMHQQPEHGQQERTRNRQVAGAGGQDCKTRPARGPRHHPRPPGARAGTAGGEESSVATWAQARMHLGREGAWNDARDEKADEPGGVPFRRGNGRKVRGNPDAR